MIITIYFDHVQIACGVGARGCPPIPPSDLDQFDVLTTYDARARSFLLVIIKYFDQM